MDATEFIIKLIKEKYKSVRQFSIAADIPYSTVKSGLKAGIGGMAVETVIKMCDILNVQMESLIKTTPNIQTKDPRQISTDEWYIISKYRELSDQAKHEIVSYLEYRSQLEKDSMNNTDRKFKT